MSHTAAQLRAAELTAKCTGGLSIVGSSTIVYDILIRKDRTKRTTLSSILLGMSLFDIGASSMYIVGSWAIPRDHGEDNPNIFQPSGTDQTCRTQAFLFQTFASAIPMYNLSLAVYSYLAVNHNWNEREKGPFRRYRMCFHILPSCFGSITATYGLLHDQFNPNELWCWFSGTEQSDMLRFVVYYGPLWVVFWTIVILFALMYRHVHQREQANKRRQFQQILEAVEVSRTLRNSTPGRMHWFRLSVGGQAVIEGATGNDTATSSASSSAARAPSSETFQVSPPVTATTESRNNTNENENSSSNHRTVATRSYSMTAAEVAAMHQQLQRQRSSNVLSRFVFTQGIQFACVFILTFLFPTIVRSQQLHKDHVRFPVLFCMTLFLPLQGFLNSLVYFKLEIVQFIRFINSKLVSLIAASSIQGRRSDEPHTNSSGGGTPGAATVLGSGQSHAMVLHSRAYSTTVPVTVSTALNEDDDDDDDVEEEEDKLDDDRNYEGQDTLTVDDGGKIGPFDDSEGASNQPHHN